nr:GPP34 family phosphoprotein [Sediminivirga luteola]
MISEDLFLLLTTDEGGKEPWTSYRDYGLAAGLLVDLTLAGFVVIDAGRWSTKVALAPEADPASPAQASLPADAPPLTFGVQALSGRKPTAVNSLVTASWFNPREAIVESLVARNIIHVQEKRMLGLVPEKHPTADPRPEAETRSRLAGALAGRAEAPHGAFAWAGTPGDHGGADAGVAVSDAVLLSILKGMGAARHVLKTEAEAAGLRGRKLDKRIDEIAGRLSAEAQSGGKAVSAAIASVNTAVTAAVMATTTTTTTTST